jgi:hypothetical protein
VHSILDDAKLWMTAGAKALPQLYLPDRPTHSSLDPEGRLMNSWQDTEGKQMLALYSFFCLFFFVFAFVAFLRACTVHLLRHMLRLW